MEKPEKHAMLQLGDSGNHQRVQPQWAPGLLACFPEILLFVTGFCFLSCPYSHCDSRQSLRCDGFASFYFPGLGRHCTEGTFEMGEQNIFRKEELVARKREGRF